MLKSVHQCTGKETIRQNYKKMPFRIEGCNMLQMSTRFSNKPASKQQQYEDIKIRTKS
jgi:hypothetical protein